MKTITCDEMVKLADQYAGKQVEISLSPFPIQSNNTYQHFRMKDMEDEFEFYDVNFGKPILQKLNIYKKDIKEIQYFEGNTYESMFAIVLENGRVEFYVSEVPVICAKCGDILEPNCEQIWILDQTGGYHSKLDMERITLNLCDNCLAEILGYEDEDYENYEDKVILN